MKNCLPNRILGTIVIVFLFVYSLSAHAAYPLAKVTNKTAFSATGTVHYAACKSDKFAVAPNKTWKARRRGLCLITSIRAQLTGKANIPGATSGSVTPYKSSGTSYGNFFIQPWKGGRRIFSDHEYKREKAKAAGTLSPGFTIHNKTQWPLAIALSQIGCLYHGVVQPGKTFKRHTGAVWFTIDINIQPDGKNPRTDWDCVKPILTVAGAAIVSAATAGAGAFLGLPAATAGSAAAALAPIATSTSVIVTGAALGAGISGATTGILTQLGKAIDKIGHVKLHGQYAGYEWPFRCYQMPVYEVTGGPARPILLDDGGFLIHDGSNLTNEQKNFFKEKFGSVPQPGPLKIFKKNTCGDKMMTLSPKAAESG